MVGLERATARSAETHTEPCAVCALSTSVIDRVRPYDLRDSMTPFDMPGRDLVWNWDIDDPDLCT